MGEERFRYKKHGDDNTTWSEEPSAPTTDSVQHEQRETDAYTEPHERFRYRKSTTNEGAATNPERFRYRKQNTDEDTEPTEDRYRYRKSTIGNEEGNVNERKHPNTRTEIFNVRGDRVVSQITQILREGNALSITLQDPYGNVIFEVPMSVGVGVTVLFPSVSALVLIGALWTNLKVVVERRV